MILRLRQSGGGDWRLHGKAALILRESSTRGLFGGTALYQMTFDEEISHQLLDS